MTTATPDTASRRARSRGDARTSTRAMPMPKIALNRRQAAEALGVSVDVLKDAQAAGTLRAKNTKFDEKTGRPVGRTLYSPAELQRWFDSLGDA